MKQGKPQKINKNNIPSTKEERSILHAASYKGPIPPPDILDKYNKIDSSFANRIITMAELEQKHRHDLEIKELNANIELNKKQFIERRIGQILGFSIGIITIISGTYLTLNGAEITGGFIGTGGVVCLVAVFVIGRKLKN